MVCGTGIEPVTHKARSGGPVRTSYLRGYVEVLAVMSGISLAQDLLSGNFRRAPRLGTSPGHRRQYRCRRMSCRPGDRQRLRSALAANPRHPKYPQTPSDSTWILKVAGQGCPDGEVGRAERGRGEGQMPAVEARQQHNAGLRNHGDRRTWNCSVSYWLSVASLSSSSRTNSSPSHG